MQIYIEELFDERIQRKVLERTGWTEELVETEAKVLDTIQLLQSTSRWVLVGGHGVRNVLDLPFIRVSFDVDFNLRPGTRLEDIAWALKAGNDRVGATPTSPDDARWVQGRLRFDPGVDNVSIFRSSRKLIKTQRLWEKPKLTRLHILIVEKGSHVPDAAPVRPNSPFAEFVELGDIYSAPLPYLISEKAKRATSELRIEEVCDVPSLLIHIKQHRRWKEILSYFSEFEDDVGSVISGLDHISTSIESGWEYFEEEVSKRFLEAYRVDVSAFLSSGLQLIREFVGELVKLK